MYYSETGQLRTTTEEQQALALYAYDISLFDFAPEDPVRIFVQKRAFVKTIMKFKDIYDLDNKRFVIDVNDSKYQKIYESLNKYYNEDAKISIVDMPKIFSNLVPFLK